MVQSQQMHRKYLLLAYNADTIAAIQEEKMERKIVSLLCLHYYIKHCVFVLNNKLEVIGHWFCLIIRGTHTLQCIEQFSYDIFPIT